MAVDRAGTLFVTRGGAIEKGVFYGGETPAFRVQPRSQAVEEGRTVAFNIAATGTPTPTYQWTNDGVAIAGATDAALIVTETRAHHAGTYRCTASNSFGAVTTAAAALTFVNAPGGSRISGFSVRANLVAGRPLVAGVVTRGGSKPVLLRAVGPGLQPFMSTGSPLMADPRLELYSASILVASNDNWGGDPMMVAAFASAGTFPLPSDGRDAALLRSLNGAHTAHIAGGSGGIVLFEAYEVAGSAGSRLANLSVRSQVTAGYGVLVAGIVVTGTTAQTVLVRGVGLRFDVRDALLDPKLEVFDAASLLQAENDNWSPGRATTEPQVHPFFVTNNSGRALAEIARRVGAFGLSSDSRDAAVLVTLSPGSYTAVLGGIGGATGEALIEVYEVP